jgi:hypothetical protein
MVDVSCSGLLLCIHSKNSLSARCRMDRNWVEYWVYHSISSILSILWDEYIMSILWVCYIMLSMLSSVFLLQFLLAERSEITRKIPLQRTCRSSYTLAVLLPGIPDASPTDEQFCFVSDKICKWMFMYPGILLGYSMSIYIYILYIYILHIHTHIYIYINIYIYTAKILWSASLYCAACCENMDGFVGGFDGHH